MRIAALVLAAGSGARFGAAQPKQFVPLAGVPLVARALAAFRGHPRVAQVVAVGPGEPIAAACPDFPKSGIVPGGATRQDSARAGLEALAADPPEAVLIHDAARPLVPVRVIDAVCEALAAGAEAVLPAIPVTDTLKRAADGIVTGTVPREGLWRVQTPQGFRFASILAAHRAVAGRSLTDDGAVAEAAGIAVRLVPGAEENLKVTTPEDLARAAAILGASLTPRVGTGFDVHRFAPDRALMLCGVRVPHPLGLAGHSDADVGIHALCDAIYGALAEGDIGTQFPPSDAVWKDADSALFLQHASQRVAARGGRIVHADVTLICERPKIAPHAAAMRERLAALMGIASGAVSVKATTTERLGFTGRGEGIAAQAAVTVLLP
ncbi:bifunctional 2-C-methyl-D-erythritol 4-phosphate cytidylyltransferase/2-C-methyl-D-erythritol 2,4-cyclodiphosphate synthase [Elioraea sp. Yellowstone]|jgi:2-C-methyl-D-erythritol 4-phosphate cytidylyltransferase/2-C-methyl-D-erythritol 2,4-cyclodiphosphate synthase|uniref:bifunctional 2-C-methyl-D-erythritol 4-phosphate cytidylyltransferase/2-C-methyl-D-erythritol 2,4-cyclodiphosphate synthase n=1 Tax=Elioraea sp. Yellowstone TaxID=2592070 RepID=UPI001154E0DA|nr:bifunctional 2-C-methyl-D-erythritol 4-phosphate cytidylyltransferase/2-C-methyl-D-erythritol 2,4-cyclodiphosphate synthase [Elioraea sp. Yellowstone]TQF80994.1 bifunctional 2-C-methyl-D-erythritol 4-phosphate cytidylyltransferase/2-C-methyl-D-erythritol 2,4-cyclodiphosphate synthase [Elioraea sp. Yellowstone]